MADNPQQTDQHPRSEKQIKTEEHKASTTLAAVLDPKFPLPALTSETPATRYILSFGMLAALLAAGLGGAWLFGVSILQSQQPAVPLSIAFSVILGALFFTGTVWIDWYELVLGYWWLSMPVGAAAGLLFVMSKEASAGIEETA